VVKTLVGVRYLALVSQSSGVTYEGLVNFAKIIFPAAVNIIELCSRLIVARMKLKVNARFKAIVISMSAHLSIRFGVLSVLEVVLC
jgi:hypothetical protein